MSNWLLKTTVDKNDKATLKIGGAVMGGKYFIYHGGSGLNDKYNEQVFQEKMGMLKAMLDFEFIQEEMGEKNRSKVIDKRKIEFKKLCDGLTKYFLLWLHDMQWSEWPEKQVDFTANNVLSCLDLDWCVDELKPIIELINILNKQVLDNKYSGKFGSMSLKNHIENITNELKHKFKPTKF